MQFVHQLGCSFIEFRDRLCGREGWWKGAEGVQKCGEGWLIECTFWFRDNVYKYFTISHQYVIRAGYAGLCFAVLGTEWSCCYENSISFQNGQQFQSGAALLFPPLGKITRNFVSGVFSSASDMKGMRSISRGERKNLRVQMGNTGEGDGCFINPYPLHLKCFRNGVETL